MGQKRLSDDAQVPQSDQQRGAADSIEALQPDQLTVAQALPRGANFDFQRR
jgi:hypothetical protein